MQLCDKAQCTNFQAQCSQETISCRRQQNKLVAAAVLAAINQYQNPQVDPASRLSQHRYYILYTRLIIYLFDTEIYVKCYSRTNYAMILSSYMNIYLACRILTMLAIPKPEAPTKLP